jgi:hypothetical protein
MHKIIGMAAVAIAATFCGGCSELLSLNEFVAAEQSVMDRSLLGVWTSKDGSFAIQQDGNEYTIRYFEKGPAFKFQARMIRVGDAKLLDVVEDTDEPFLVPVHFLVRVWTEGSTLSWTFLDSDWMKEQTGRRVALQPRDKSRLIVASGAQWSAELLKFAADDKAYNNRNELTRVQ